MVVVVAARCLLQGHDEHAAHMQQQQRQIRNTMIASTVGTRTTSMHGLFSPPTLPPMHSHPAPPRHRPSPAMLMPGEPLDEPQESATHCVYVPEHAPWHVHCVMPASGRCGARRGEGLSVSANASRRPSHKRLSPQIQRPRKQTGPWDLATVKKHRVA